MREGGREGGRERGREREREREREGERGKRNPKCGGTMGPRPLQGRCPRGENTNFGGLSASFGGVFSGPRFWVPG